VSLDPEALRKATEHDFLKRAAQGDLPQEQLVSWLAQDRLYAISYVSFMGQLLSKVPISSASDRSTTLNWRIADCLINCLDNIRRELRLFEETAEQCGWTEELGGAKPTIHTQVYRDLFAGAGQGSSTLFRGLVTLWATEKCYLLAWSHAKAHLPETSSSSQDVMQKVFIPNWSSNEFVEFVDVLERLMDEMATEASVEDIDQAEEQWRQVVWAEENFWPPVGT